MTNFVEYVILIEDKETAFLLGAKGWLLSAYSQIPCARMVPAEVAVAGMRYNKL